QVWINYIHIMTYDFFLCLFFGKSNDSKGGASISSKTKKRQARGSVIEINLDNMRDKAIFNQPEINDSRRYRMKKQRKHTRVTTPLLPQVLHYTLTNKWGCVIPLITLRCRPQLNSNPVIKLILKEWSHFVPHDSL